MLNFINKYLNVCFTVLAIKVFKKDCCTDIHTDTNTDIGKSLLAVSVLPCLLFFRAIRVCDEHSDLKTT